MNILQESVEKLYSLTNGELILLIIAVAIFYGFTKPLLKDAFNFLKEVFK